MSHDLFICTDLDRTLIPNGPQPESPQARERFATLVAHSGVGLAYASGRHLELVEQAIADYHLPVPDFIIGDVGTTIYVNSGDAGWSHDDAWEQELLRDWGGKTHTELSGLLGEVNGIRLQEEDRQNVCKLSYYTDLVCNKKVLHEDVGRRLRDAGVHCNLVWSADEARHTGLLDVLPVSANKLHALSYLIHQLGIGLEQTVFCGDSGNDVEVMVSAVPSVLVANSSDEVREHALRQADLNGHAEHLYIAQGGFLGMNGNYAAGMLEGIAYFQPHTANWMGLSGEVP